MSTPAPPDFTAAAPTVGDYTDGRRMVRFIAMQHIARPAFFREAARVLREAQEDGYVHFYEFIDMYALDDAGQRKVRKLTGLIPMPDAYGRVAEALGRELGVELTAQPQRDLIGLVNDRDVNADVTPEEFLRRIEAAVGPIELSPEDLDTPLDEPVTASIPPERWMPVALDARNACLAEAVHRADEARIVITFGAAHEAGWLAALRELDPRWARAAAAPA